MNNKKLFIKYLIAFLTVILLWIIVVVYAQTRQEPIQKILNQIEANESELQQIETRANELNKANEEAKSRLLNEYWLELSKAFAKNVEQKAETDLSALIYDENWNCI